MSHNYSLFILALALSMLVKISADDILKYFLYVFQKIEFYFSCKLSPLQTVCMNCQISFSEKYKKNLINLTSAESAHSMVSISMTVLQILKDGCAYRDWPVPVTVKFLHYNGKVFSTQQ